MPFPKILELKKIEANLETISLSCLNDFPIYSTFLSSHDTNIKKLSRYITNYLCVHFTLCAKLNNYTDLERLCFEIGKRLYARVKIKIQRSNCKGFHKSKPIGQLKHMPFLIYCNVEKQEKSNNYELKLTCPENNETTKVNSYFEKLMKKQKKDKENKVIEKELEKVGLELSSDSENENTKNEEKESCKYFLTHKEENCESCHIEGASFEDFQDFLDEHSKENLQGLKDTIFDNYAALVKTTEIFMDFMHKITQSVEKLPVYYDDTSKKWKISCSMCASHCPRFYNSAQLRGAGRPPVRH